MVAKSGGIGVKNQKSWFLVLINFDARLVIEFLWTSVSFSIKWRCWIKWSLICLLTLTLYEPVEWVSYLLDAVLSPVEFFLTVRWDRKCHSTFTVWKITSCSQSSFLVSENLSHSSTSFSAWQIRFSLLEGIIKNLFHYFLGILKHLLLSSYFSLLRGGRMSWCFPCRIITVG